MKYRLSVMLVGERCVMPDDDGDCFEYMRIDDGNGMIRPDIMKQTDVLLLCLSTAVLLSLPGERLVYILGSHTEQIQAAGR